MYPIVRFAKELLRHRSAPPLSLTQEHAATHVCWPWDVDPWLELNNGRVLTLYDLGRIVLFQRLGVVPVMRAHGWGGVVAGASIRYRRRVRAFQRYTLRSRLIGWDARFCYVEQSMWVGGECASHGLMRVALTDKRGMIPPESLPRAMDLDPDSPPLPDWVRAWIDAEAQRPWPPMQGKVAVAATGTDG